MKVYFSQLLSISALALLTASTTAHSTSGASSEKLLERKLIQLVPVTENNEMVKRAGSPYNVEGSFAAISNLVARDMLQVGPANVSMLKRAEDDEDEDEECEEEDDGEEEEECREPIDGDDDDDDDVSCDNDEEDCDDDEDNDGDGVDSGVGFSVDAGETPNNLAEGSLSADDGCTAYVTTVKGDTCYKLIGTKDADTLKKFYADNPSVDTGCQNLEIGLAYCTASS